MENHENNSRRYRGNGRPKRPNERKIASDHAWFLDQFEELRMNLSDDQLIAEAVAINHGNVKPKTVARYQDHLIHFSQYLASAKGEDFYSAKSKHVRLFMAHLEKEGGAQPHALRLDCSWCKLRGYPDGKGGSKGWSPSYRKSYLSAIKFLYKHFAEEDDLPDHNPASLVPSPKVVPTRGYTPSAEDVQKLHSAPGSPMARLLACWIFYAPSRRAPFSTARWRDIDLDQGTWDVVGKGDVADVFDLHPMLSRQLRHYRAWQLSEAKRNPDILNALSDPETAFVLLSRKGKPTHASSINKMLKRLAVSAGVGVVRSECEEAIGGKTSRLSPHALRRSWATVALNEGEVPIDVVSAVLKHKDISTTRRHYAPTKPERARQALREMNLGKGTRKRERH
jgi:integrase